MRIPKQSKPVSRFISPVKNSGFKGVQASNDIRVMADRIQGGGGDFEDCDCRCRIDRGADLGGPDGVFRITYAIPTEAVSTISSNNNNNDSL